MSARAGLLLKFPTSRCSSRCRAFSTTQVQRAGEVRVVEVGPRDGLQNESQIIGTDTKLELIRRLSKTGVRNIEAGSFVAPKWVPQMADSAEILNSLNRDPPAASGSIAYNFLVPNLTGLGKLLKAYDSAMHTEAKDPASQQHHDAPPTPPPSPKPGQMFEEPAPITSTQDPNAMGSEPLHNFSKPSLDSPHTYEISVFLAATEAFSRANTNCSIAESIDRCKGIIRLAKSRSLPVRGYVSVALGCPYEGPSTPPSKVADITASLLEMGVDEVSVADTTGMGTAPKTRELLKALFAAGISPNDLALHFHDTYGQALVNAVVGLEHGIRTFDSSVGGLGGCPFSKGATGNVSTEDLVHCLHSLGAKTGVDLEEMSRIGEWISKELGRPNESRAGKAVLSRLNS